MSEMLPLFPLNLVLFPDGPLKLRIFEPRYVDMVGRCMRESTAFGVACIVAGVEAGGAAETARVGTTARIVDFEQLEDGLLGVTAIGERSFTIKSTHQQSDGLYIAEVEWLPPETTQPVSDQFEHLASVLPQAMAQAASVYAHAPKRFGDASWESARWVELLPLPLVEKQRCLEIRDGEQRLAYLSTLITVDESH
jgi:uncharacterized protein